MVKNIMREHDASYGEAKRKQSAGKLFDHGVRGGLLVEGKEEWHSYEMPLECGYVIVPRVRVKAPLYHRYLLWPVCRVGLLWTGTDLVDIGAVAPLAHSIVLGPVEGGVGQFDATHLID